MKKLWNRINIWIKIVMLLMISAIAAYGIVRAPASDQTEMEQELKSREQALQKEEQNRQMPPSPAASPAEPNPSGKPGIKKEKITVIADSVFLGAAPSFKKMEKDAVIDAKISRQVRHGLDVAKKLEKKNQLGDIVILSLGTNSPFNPATGQELINYLGKERTVYWVNAYGKNLDFQKEVNKTIRELSEKNSNVHVISWAKEAKKHPDWFYQDGTHLNVKGQEGFAKYVRAEIRK